MQMMQVEYYIKRVVGKIVVMRIECIESDKHQITL